MVISIALAGALGLGAGLSFLGGQATADADRQAAKIQAEEARRQRKLISDLYRDAQQKYEKTVNEALEDYEWNAYARENAVDQQLAGTIRDLNNSETGAIEELNNLEADLAKKDKENFDNSMQELVQSGKLTIEQYDDAIQTFEDGHDGSIDALRKGFSADDSDRVLEDGSLDPNNIYNIIESNYSISKEEIQDAYDDSEKAVLDANEIAIQELRDGGILSRDYITQGAEDALLEYQGFQDLRDRNILQNKVFQGIATTEELAKYNNDFAGIETDPIYEYRINQATDALQKIQRAQGYSLSPAAAREILEGANLQITSDQAQALREMNQQGLNRGMQTSQSVANIQRDTASQLANSIGDETRQVAGIQRGQGEQIANIRDRQNIAMQNLNRDRAELETAASELFNTSLSNLEAKYGPQKAALMLDKANQQKAITERNVGYRDLFNDRSLSLQKEFGDRRLNMGQRYSDARLNAQNQANQTRRALGSARDTNILNARIGQAANQADLSTAPIMPQANLGLQAAGFDAQATTANQRANADFFQGLSDIALFESGRGSARQGQGSSILGGY
tara:strand:- start:9803 stop:11506 length:1704 start_codon:yes stop_codon:yes gene_type:complete